MLAPEPSPADGAKLDFVPAPSPFADIPVDSKAAMSSPLRPGQAAQHSENPFTSSISRRAGSLGWIFETEEDEDEDAQRPLLEELDIDPLDILYKIRCVIVPYQVDREVLVRSPDFWGPLLVVLLYSVLIIQWSVCLVVSATFRSVSWVLSIWFGGALLIWLLIRVLGAEASYATTLGVIGYCLLPQLVLLLPRFVRLYAWPLRILGILWGALSAGTLLASATPKRSMVYVPMILLYTYFDAVATN